MFILCEAVSKSKQTKATFLYSRFKINIKNRKDGSDGCSN